MIQIAVFAVVAAAAVIAGVFLVLTRNAVHSALFLVGVQLCLAVLFLLQGAFLVSVLQIMVYAGAIMVLFIFVVMLLGVDKKEALVEPLRWQRPLAAGLGLLLAAEAVYLALSQHIHLGSGGLKAGPHEGNVQAVARVLFTHWALPFEATSVLLVVAVVGVMVVARRPRPSSSGRTEGRTEETMVQR
jgi:NADH-quinone oxidoreductase subunit J